jgi:phenylpropionate dioxygenase-like ring-hydroxylating dioxygenase large terminal subunit
MYPTRFPRNQWYVIARTEELDEHDDRPLARTVLNDRVVLFRDVSGKPSALEDRCLHRSMPLSLGTLHHGQLQCRYHGITYDGSGAVVDIPCQTGVPAGRRARSFPLAYGAHLIWIWPGDPARADHALLPDHAWLDGPEWRTVSGTLHMDARAQLLNENLTDLSHVSYLHNGSIGTSEVARTPIHVEVDGRVLRVHRPMPDVECPPFFSKVMGISGRITRDSVAEFVAPSYHVSHVAARPLEHDGSSAFRHRAVHCITPETETTAHYHWLIARDYRREEVEVDELWRTGAPQVFAEDVDAVEAIEAVLRTYPSDGPMEINISADAGSLRARALVEKLIADDDRH